MNATFDPLALNDRDKKSLSEVLGVPEDVLILTESEFDADSGRSAAFRETWLKTACTQHDILAVVAGTTKAGSQPWLLLHEQSGTVRLFSLTDETLWEDALDEIEFAARFQKPGQAPVSAAAVLDWWEVLEQARKLFMDACRGARAYPWGKEEEAVALQCVAEIEKRIPLMNSRRLWDVKAQWNAIEKCTILCCKIATYCGDVANVVRLTELIGQNKSRWAALVEALCASRWLTSDSPRAYLNRATKRIYSSVRPDIAGLDSQGMRHGSTHRSTHGSTKISDALHPNRYPLPLEEIDKQPIETVVERRFTQDSVLKLQDAARKDPRLASYIQELILNPKRKPADIWRELGWNEREGKAIDRKFRRLRERLRAQGAGMEWREAPVPGASDASKSFTFEVLEDGAKGARFGVYQHKSLKANGK